MKGYNFKFERVLNYKKTVEDYKKSQYGDLQQRLNREEEMLLEYNHCKENLIMEKNKSIQKISVGHLKMYNSYLNDINDTISKQEEIIDETKIKLEIAKEELMEAMKEKKVFEKLKENDYKQYVYEAKKVEEKLLDSIVSYNITTQQ